MDAYSSLIVLFGHVQGRHLDQTVGVAIMQLNRSANKLSLTTVGRPPTAALHRRIRQTSQFATFASH